MEDKRKILNKLGLKNINKISNVNALMNRMSKQEEIVHDFWNDEQQIIKIEKVSIINVQHQKIKNA